MRTSIVVTPTEESIKRVLAIVQSTVLAIKGDLMNIEVAVAEGLTPNWSTSENTYTDIQVKDVKIVPRLIDTGGSISQLVAWIESASLGRRRQELGGNYDPLFPWVLAYDVPPGRTATRVITHLTDVLVYREPPFSFSNETLLQV